MALTRAEARIREKAQLRRYLATYRDDGLSIPTTLQVEAMNAFDEMTDASPENVLWATIRHAAGDPGTLRAKIAVRAQRNGPPNIDWPRVTRMLSSLIPAGFGKAGLIEQAMMEIAEAAGVVEQRETFAARVRRDHAG